MATASGLGLSSHLCFSRSCGSDRLASAPLGLSRVKLAQPRACSSQQQFHSEPSVQQTGHPPMVELEFLGAEGPAYDPASVDRVTVASGEKLLRTVMIDNKMELYGLYGKIMNCGGGGSCGTCLVEIIEGSNLLNERTDAEARYLKKKPESWRLACQTIVGDKLNSGKVVVQRLPQKKK